MRTDMKNIMMFLLAALYGGQVLAAEVAPNTEKVVTAAKKKVKKHPCVEHEGRPCHLKKYTDEAASKETKPATPAPLESIKAAVPVVAPVVVPLAAAVVQPEPVDALALAKKHNCMGCHALETKVFGPAWKAVAVKYRGDAKAEAYLVNRIASGGSGVWGSNAMPAHPKISEADRSALARFVLNLQ